SAGISFSSARAPQNLTIPRQQQVSSSLLRNTLEEDQSFSAENCPRGCAWRGARAGGICPSRVVLGARPPRGVPPGRRGQRRPQRLLEFFEGQDDFVALHPCEEGIPAVVLTYSGSSGVGGVDRNSTQPWDGRQDYGSKWVASPSMGRMETPMYQVTTRRRGHAERLSEAGGPASG